MKETTKQLKNILENKRGNLYDFIADNYWQLDREVLKGLALEITCLLYVYASRENPQDTEKANRLVHSELLEQIREYRPELLEEGEE